MSELDVKGTARLNEGPAVRALQGLGRAFRGFANRSGVTSLGKAFQGVGKSLRGVVALGGPLAGIFGAGGVLATANFAKTYAAGTDELAKFSRQIRFSIQGFRELSFVADRQGVSQGTLNSSMQAFSKRLGEAKLGTGALASALKKSNPELLNQLKSAQSAEEAFGLMIGALSQIKNPAERAALASAAFSRSGLSMSRIAEAGADGIANLREEARKYLGVLTDADGASAEGFVDMIANLTASFKGLGDAIGKKLLPVLQPYGEQLTEWVAANREIIATNVAGAVEKIAAALAQVDWGAVGESISKAAKAFDGFAQSVGGYENLFIGIGVAITAAFLAPVAQVLINFGRLGVALGGIGVKATKAAAKITAAFGKLHLKSLVSPLKIGSLVVGTLKWSLFIPKLVWKTLVNPLQIAALIRGKVKWGTFINPLKWGSFTSPLKVGTLLKGVIKWSGWIKPLKWGAFASVLSIGSLIVGAIKWDGWIPSLSWSSFVESLDWTKVISAILWTSSIIPGIGWVGFIGALLWDNVITQIDWSKYFNLETIKSMIDQVRQWLSGLWDGFKSFVGLGKSVSANNGDPRSRRSRVRQSTPPGRATGGPIFKGLGYLTGERGKEVIFPQQNGFVLNNSLFTGLLEVLKKGQGHQSGGGEILDGAFHSGAAIPPNFAGLLTQALRQNAAPQPGQSILDINFSNAPSGTNANFKQKGRPAFSHTTFKFRDAMGFGA